jgi:hypothetical protein
VGKRWDALADISRISCPTLFLCGGADELTPLSMTQELRAASPSPLIVVHVNPDATHNDNWSFTDDVLEPMRQMLSTSDENESLARLNQVQIFTPQLRDAQSTVAQSVSFECAPITIVGAGPVGLWLAASLVELGVKDKIVLLEKHLAYQRHHVLRLDGSSLEGAPPLLRALIAPLVGVTKTSLLETRLHERCMESKGQISIVRGVTVGAPLDGFADARVLVGCDGSHSVIRDLMLGGVGVRDKLQHVLDVRLLIGVGLGENSEPPKKQSLPQTLSSLSAVFHIVEESVSRTANTQGDYPATLRLLIDATEYNALRSAGASLRAPLSLPESELYLPASIASTIRGWLASRRLLWPHERYSQITCTALDLAIYCARTFSARSQHGQSVFIAGDAVKKQSVLLMMHTDNF